VANNKIIQLFSFKMQQVEDFLFITFMIVTVQAGGELYNYKQKYNNKQQLTTFKNNLSIMTYERIILIIVW